MKHKVKNKGTGIAAMAILILSFSLAACTQQPAGITPVPQSSGDQPFGFEEFVGELQGAGASVEPAGEVDQPFFGESARDIRVDGADLQVFEFADQASQQAAPQTISANGYIIGTTAVDWISQPYFWARGRLIALYVGADRSIIDLVTGLMGDPLTFPRSGSGSVSPAGEIGDLAGLIEALRAAGASVETAGEINQAFFEPGGHIVRVNGADVQVFEFPDERARQAASDQISPSGSSIGTTMVTWVDQPHFWAKGRLIVLYVGSDDTLLDQLVQVLGDPITAQ